MTKHVVTTKEESNAMVTDGKGGMAGAGGTGGARRRRAMTLRGRKLARLAPFVAMAPLAIACGDRPDAFDAPITGVRAVGLETQVAVLDEGGHRAILLTPANGEDLERTSVPVGKNVIDARASSDGKHLFVLAGGDTARKKGDREKPSLTVVTAATATSAAVTRRFELESPHSGIAIDDEGRWVALFATASGSSTNFVENPNELVLVDLSASDDTAVTTRTIRSFGGLPQRVSFTPTLLLPGGPRRLLVVETNQDLALLDLDNLRAVPSRPEVTVRLTSGSSTIPNQPAGVVFDDGDPAKNDDARIGVRLSNASNVVTLTLVANTPGANTEDPNQVPNDFRPLVNLTDVGGIPGQIAFVRTDLGRRLAAVVPSTRKAVLVDPDTSITVPVDLPASYTQISLVTGEIGDVSGKDTALLYGDGASGVALWSLGRAEGEPYRSIEAIALTAPVSNVLDVPAPHAQLKVLQSRGANAFFVMDLATRTASPLLTQGSASLFVARDGQRLWAYGNGATSLSRISLDNLHPVPISLDQPANAVFDVASRLVGRALVTLNTSGAVSATVLDALNPDVAPPKTFYGLLFEDLR